MRGDLQLPATSANIGPGFDVWGVALSLQNKFSWECSPRIRESRLLFKNISELVTQTIPDGLKKIEQMLQDQRNDLLLNSYTSLFKGLNRKPVPIRVEMDVNVPFSRGLGSSATMILAGFLIARKVLYQSYGVEKSTQEVFHLACHAEGHCG